MRCIDPRLLRDERIEALEAFQTLSKARIAELEAENARLNGSLSDSADVLISTLRERDEARLYLLEQTDRLVSERDEARAACAAKDEALKEVAEWLPQRTDLECPDDIEALGTFKKRIKDTLSSTCGSELLARLEKAEADHTDSEKALIDSVNELSARLEKAEAERFLAEEAHGELQRTQAQLEATRAALERVRYAHLTVGQFHAVEAALSPSAPRLYRNAVLEEAAKVAESAKTEWWSPAIAADIRALKSSEPEGGT